MRLKPTQVYLRNSRTLVGCLFTAPKVLIELRSHTYQHSKSKAFSTSTKYSNNRYYKPKLEGREQNQDVHVLTLLTDVAHNRSMNALRKAYFPSHLNKVGAHISLFRGLPGSKLESEIVPVLEEIVARTAPYQILAIRPFRLSKGIAIHVADNIERDNADYHGNTGPETEAIHNELRRRWSNWLSEQDSSPARLHYTVMNKVSNKEVINGTLKTLEQAFEQNSQIHDNYPSESSEGGNELRSLRLQGEAQGLTLWKYEKTGHWTNPRHFRYRASRS